MKKNIMLLVLACCCISGTCADITISKTFHPQNAWDLYVFADSGELQESCRVYAQLGQQSNEISELYLNAKALAAQQKNEAVRTGSRQCLATCENLLQRCQTLLNMMRLTRNKGGECFSFILNNYRPLLQRSGIRHPNMQINVTPGQYVILVRESAERGRLLHVWVRQADTRSGNANIAIDQLPQKMR